MVFINCLIYSAIFVKKQTSIYRKFKELEEYIKREINADNSIVPEEFED